MRLMKINNILIINALFFLIIPCLHPTETRIPHTKSPLFFYGKQVPKPTQEVLERHAMMQEQPLAYKPFIDPRFSFQVGSSDASQVSPMFLTAYWHDPRSLYTQTGGNKDARIKGMLKLLLLIEAQYVQKVPVYRLTEYERQKILQENFYNFLNKIEGKINYNAQRRLKSGIHKFFNTKRYREKEELKKQQYQIFEQATPEQIIPVFKGVMESLVTEFMNRPVLPLDQQKYVFGYGDIITPGFIDSCANDNSDIFDPRPSKQTPQAKLERLREVAIALNFVFFLVENGSVNSGRSNAYEKFKQTFGKDPKSMSDPELRALIVQISRSFMKTSGLDKFVRAINTSPSFD